MERNGMATTGMVFGIISCVLAATSFSSLGFLPFIGLGLGIPAICLGAKTKNNGKGKAALVTGIVGTSLSGIELLFHMLLLGFFIQW